MWPALGSRAGSHLLTATSGAFTERPESSLALALVKCVKRALCNVQKFNVPIRSQTRELFCASFSEMCSVQSVSILSQPPESSLALSFSEICSVQCISILSQPPESSLALALVVHWTKVQ